MTAARFRLLDDASLAGLVVRAGRRNKGISFIHHEARDIEEAIGVIILSDGSMLATPIDGDHRNPRSFREVREALGIRP